MNFLEAINAHRQWKLRITHYMHGDLHEHLDPNVVQQDDQCNLGKWLYKNKKKLNHKTGVFEDVRISHSYFHDTAAEIVRCIDNHEQQHALELYNGKYSTISHNLQKHILDLAREFNQPAHSNKKTKDTNKVKLEHLK